MPPVLIVALVLVALVVGAYLFGLSPQPVRGRRPTPAILRRRSKWRKWLPVLPLAAAVACLALAFSGFRFNLQEESSPTIMLVMDVSNSMRANDVAPNRLAAARAAALAFLDELPADFRVGLATFATEARVEVPPTLDREGVRDALEAPTTAQGTVIGDGLSAALDAIEDVREAGDAVAVLLSDGQDTNSSVPPRQAAERASEMGVPVFTVLLGQVQGGDGGGGANLEAMEEIAMISGGEAFTAETAGALTARFENLGSQLSVDLDVKSFSTPLVMAAIGLVIVAGLMLVLIQR